MADISHFMAVKVKSDFILRTQGTIKQGLGSQRNLFIVT